MTDIPLGKKTPTPTSYAPEVLFPIERARGRAELTSPVDGWCGFDRWRCYEFSFLLPHGRPFTGILSFSINAQTKQTVESKSLKLYLGSLNNHTFTSVEDATSTVATDLRACLADPLEDLTMTTTPCTATLTESFPWGTCIDDEASAAHSAQTQNVITEQIHSHNLRTLCPITSQPDWATVWINYTGTPLDYNQVAAYLCSLREHSGFHETCCEEIFTTVGTLIETAQHYTVGCFFTRRGGIDINPIRWTSGTTDNAIGHTAVPRVGRQ